MLLTLAAEAEVALECGKASYGLLCSALAVLVPCQEASQVLDGTVGLVTTYGGAPEAQLREGMSVSRRSTASKCNEASSPSGRGRGEG